MATVSPARQMYEIAFSEGLWWEQNGGATDIYPDSPYLLVSATGDLAAGKEFARAALKFSTTAADWAAIGDITEAHAVLWMYLDSKGSDTGTGIYVGNITDAWTMASNQTTMSGIGIGGWSAPITPSPDLGQGWVAIDLGAVSATYLRNANGLCLKANLTAFATPAFKFMKDPAPTGRAYLWYDVIDTVHGSATDRLEADTDALAALTKSRGLYSIGGEIIQSHYQPDESDVSIDIGKGSSLSITDHTIQTPETWKLDRGSQGALSLSRAEVDMLDYRGSILEVSLKHRIAQKAETTLATQKCIIGKVDKNAISQEVTTGDILYESLSMTPYYRNSALGIETVNILTEPRLYALILILINGGGIPWSRFRQADLVWLLRRFGNVWDDITISAVDMADYTVGSLVEEIGQQYGLCVSRGGDDSIVLWHPAIYRPSMKIWSINDKDIDEIVYRKVSTVDQYDSVSINTDEIQWDSSLPLKLDGRDKDYPVTGLTGIFVNPAAGDVTRYALGRQLAQRLVGPHEEYEFLAGARAIMWEDGDKLKITSTRNVLSDTVFTIMSVKGDPTTGKHRVMAMRWPDSLGLQSTWEATDVMGIYRLAEWDTGTGTGANQSHDGTAGDFTVTAINNLSNMDWRGPLANVDITAPATFAPSYSNYYDLVDFVLGVFGRQDEDPHPAGDSMYTRILVFRDASSTNAVVCGIKRVASDNGGGGSYYSTTDTRIFLGATNNYTDDPIIWNHAGADYIETPPGLSNGSWSWNYGVAIQWYQDQVRLYVDQVYIGTITGFDADIDTCEFETPVLAEHRVGCIRWLRSLDGWFSTDRLVGRAGEDTYYP